MIGSSRRLGYAATLALLGLLLSACDGQGSAQVNTGTTTGTITVNNSNDIVQYTVGTAIDMPVTLSGITSTTPVQVNFTSDIASLTPATCYLSKESNTCRVMVRGATAGQGHIRASAPGFNDALIAVSFGGTPPGTPDYGSVQIGVYPSATAPSTTNFDTTAQLGQVVRLQTSLTGFNQALDGVPILLSTTAGSFIGNPQCSVDSTADQNHYCLYELQLPATAPSGNTVTVTASVVGAPAGYQTWNAPTVTITTQTAAVPGTIVLQKRTTDTPVGMSSPMWAVLQDSSGVSDTVVSVSSDNANVTINPEIKANSSNYQPNSCTLSSSHPVCGFGVLGVTTGTASISALSNPASYTIASLPFTITQPLTSSRTIKFTNTSTSPVWVGITGGTANSYQTEELVSTIDPASSGPNKMCGPSNPAGGCPTGSTCRQGGANPSSSTTYFCYWDQPVPTNGDYKIAAGSAAPSTSISVSDSSYDPIADITWSGNFFPREGCTLNSGQLSCTIADCGGGNSGSACAPGTGGSPAVATLPEVTLQPHSTDYYDVSIIAGANVITSFGPDSAASTTDNPVPAANGYQCGTAGASAAQGTLKAADWSMATHVAATLVTGGSTPYSYSAQTGATKSAAYFHLISTESPRQNTACTTNTDCTTTPSFVCGYDINAVGGGSPDYQTSCGTHLAWMSANAIWALNAQTSTNAAPFKFSGSYLDSASASINYYQLFTCTAPTVSGYSSPITDNARVCGCTDWGDTSFSTTGDAPFSSQIATPSKACTANNTVAASYEWTTYVLPTIAWLKASCPTCYTYPFDDMSSTFQCSNQSSSTSKRNTVPYVITFGGKIPGK